MDLGFKKERFKIVRNENRSTAIPTFGKQCLFQLIVMAQIKTVCKCWSIYKPGSFYTCSAKIKVCYISCSHHIISLHKIQNVLGFPQLFS